MVVDSVFGGMFSDIVVPSILDMLCVRITSLLEDMPSATVSDLYELNVLLCLQKFKWVEVRERLSYLVGGHVDVAHLGHFRSEYNRLYGSFYLNFDSFYFSLRCFLWSLTEVDVEYSFWDNVRCVWVREAERESQQFLYSVSV